MLTKAIILIKIQSRLIQFPVFHARSIQKQNTNLFKTVDTPPNHKIEDVEKSPQRRASNKNSDKIKEIRNLSQVDQLIEYYKENKNTFGVKQFSIILSQIERISTPRELYKIRSNSDVIELVENITENLKFLESIEISYFFKTYISMGMRSLILCKSIADIALSPSFKGHNKFWVNMFYLMAKHNYSNDDFNKKAINNFSYLTEFDNKTLTQIYWAISILKVKNLAFMKKLDEEILKKQGNLNERTLSNLLRAYSVCEYVSEDVLAMVIKTIIHDCDQFSFQALAAILHGLGDLKIKNFNMLQVVKNTILKKAATLDEEISKREELTSEDIDELYYKAFAPIDCSQLLSALCKMECFDPQLLEKLETSFIRNIEKANPDSILNLFVAHSVWARTLFEDLMTKKEKRRKVYKIFMKYNETFAAPILVKLDENTQTFNIRGIYLILTHAHYAHLMKRENYRTLYQISLKGLLQLSEMKFVKSTKEGEDSFDLMCAKYFALSEKFCLKDEEKTKLLDAFYQHGIPIREIIEKLDPLEYTLEFEKEAHAQLLEDESDNPTDEKQKSKEERRILYLQKKELEEALEESELINEESEIHEKSEHELIEILKKS